jgi:hypothetical protein
MTENGNLPVSRQVAAVQGRSAKGKVTGRLKLALSRMVWAGENRSVAAAAVGLQDDSLRRALKKRHVMAAYLAECEILRKSGRARRIHRLEELSEQNSNMQAAVNANRALENMGDDAAATAGTVQRAGMLIVVVDGAGRPLPVQPVQAPLVIENDPINAHVISGGRLPANREDDAAE